jgi:hypothetical protein
LLVALVVWLPLSVLIHTLGVPAATINIVTLIGILVGCLGVAATRLALAPYALWFPMPWFLLTSAAYYGFGPLLYYFGTAETVNQVDGFYLINDALLLQCNVLTVSGIVVVLLVYLSLSAAFGSKPADGVITQQARPLLETTALWRVAIVFVMIGVLVKVFLVIPTAVGLWDVVLPGSIEYFGQFSSLALVPLLILATAFRRLHFALFTVLLGFEVVTAFIQLSKLAIMKIGLLVVLAMVLRGTSVRKLALIGVLSVLLYTQILVPLVGYGRIAFDVLGVKGVSEAGALLQEFAGGTAQDRLASVMPGVQSWWARLNYAPAQGFALDSYDEGLAGDTFQLAIWVFVPRVIYPEKPITTTGSKFNELVTRNPDSKSAPGMFAEGYWNAGWIGLIVVAGVMGAWYWGWERYTRARLIPRLRIEYVPIAWMGLFAAIQQDSWFVPTTLGVIPFAILFHVLIRIFLSGMLLRGSSPREAPALRRGTRRHLLGLGQHGTAP